MSKPVKEPKALIKCNVCGRFKIDDLNYPFFLYRKGERKIWVCKDCKDTYEEKEGLSGKKWNVNIDMNEVANNGNESDD